jgi:prevent-host-death family protein
MKIASLAEVKSKFSTYLKESKESGPVIITRNGKAVAVILAPVDDDDLERLVLSRSPRFQALLKESTESIRAGGGISHAEYWNNVRDRNVDLPNSDE